MRILITVEPLMYRESIALAIHEKRPDIEVMIAFAGTLDGQAESFDPHLLMRNDTDGADMTLVTGALCWIEVLYSDGMNARVSLDGKVRDVENMSIEDLLVFVAEAETLIPELTVE